jgi:RNA polymerase sigma factor (sigma-70 family)
MATIDSIRDYLQAIARYPLLTPEEEIELGHQIQAGIALEAKPPEQLTLDDRWIIQQGLWAKQKMVQANLRLVVMVAKRYQNRGLAMLDLLQEGAIGLQRGAEKFDPTRGYKFSTYAFDWISQAMIRAIGQHSRTIRLPIHILEMLNKIKKARRELSQELGQSPTRAEIAAHLGISLQKMEGVISSANQVNLIALDQMAGDSEIPLLEAIADPYTNGLAEEEYDRAYLRQKLEELLNAYLTTIEREVVLLRSAHGLTLSAIAPRLGLSRERVRQIANKALSKLRLHAAELLR